MTLFALHSNQTKLSGQCGRLKCCLNYELDTYLDALQHFPDNADVIQITRCPACLVKKDIFKNLMWYTTPDSNKHYPLTIARVKEIQQMNAKGLKPDELEAVELTTLKPKEIEPEFVDVVGQISLQSLERNKKKEKTRNKANKEAVREEIINQDKDNLTKGINKIGLLSKMVETEDHHREINKDLRSRSHPIKVVLRQRIRHKVTASDFPGLFFRILIQSIPLAHT